MKQADAKALGAFLNYGLGDGPGDARAAALRAAPVGILSKAKAAGRRRSRATAQRRGRRLADGSRSASPHRTGGRSVLERPLRARLPDQLLRWVLTGARGRRSWS